MEQCRRATDCLPGEECIDGVCLEAADPCAGEVCGEDEVCVQGECHPTSCHDRGCAEGLICLDGQCVAPSCLDVECGEGEACANGMCYPTDCGGVDCGGGVCVDGECVPRSCVGVSCENDQACANGICYPVACEAACALGEVCVDNECVAVECVGVSCQAGTICHEGRCTEGCTIDGSFVPHGTTNPADRCRLCDVLEDDSSWTMSPDGTICDEDDNICTVHSCLGGSCTQLALPAGTDCGGGAMCDGMGSCEAGCMIDGGFHYAGALRPNEPCLHCDPQESTATWTNLAAGTSCGPEHVCDSVGTCMQGCWIAGSFYAPLDPHPTNVCKWCLPEATTDAWTNRAGSSCGSGSVCTSAGQCVRGCWIDGAYRAHHEANPENECRWCHVDHSTSSWTDKPYGSPCMAWQGECRFGVCVY